MGSIARQLTSPEWWFTVVVVGLIIGIASAYAKDWLSSILSSLSSRYRKFAEAKSEATSREIQVLSENIEMLVIEYIRALFRLIASIVFLTSSYFLPGWNLLRKQFPEVDPLLYLFSFKTPIEMLGLSNDVLQAIGSMLLASYGLFLWNSFLNRYSLCEEVRTLILERYAET